MPRVVAAPPTHSPKEAALGGLEVQKLDGEKTTLDAARAGRPTLVALWATWCETCTRELGAIARLAIKAEGAGGYVVAVSEGEERAVVEGFTHDHDLRYPVLLDGDYHLCDALGARSVPTTVVLDRKGFVTFTGGALTTEAIDALQAAIDKK